MSEQQLKQLVFSLSVCADGAVPVHHKVYAGNRTDDTTHIETWKTVRKITSQPDFRYVADSKLCTDEQLSYIVAQGGRAITLVPLAISSARNYERFAKHIVCSF
jgi:transposase